MAEMETESVEAVKNLVCRSSSDVHARKFNFCLSECFDNKSYRYRNGIVSCVIYIAPEITEDNFEDLLAIDDVLLDYFNEFLALPVCFFSVIQDV